MTIRLGIDADWDVRQQALRQQSIRTLMEALNDRDERRRRMAMSEATALASLPGLDQSHLDAFARTHGEKNPDLVTSLQAALTTKGAMTEFMERSSTAKNEYATFDRSGAAVRDVASALAATPLMGLGGAGPMVGQMMGQAGEDAAWRAKLNTDPSGFSQAFAGLDPTEKMAIIKNLQGMGLGLDRLQGDPLQRNLENYTPTLRPLVEQAARGQRPVGDIKMLGDVQAGLIRSPAELDEEAAQKAEWDRQLKAREASQMRIDNNQAKNRPATGAGVANYDDLAKYYRDAVLSTAGMRERTVPGSMDGQPEEIQAIDDKTAEAIGSVMAQIAVASGGNPAVKPLLDPGAVAERFDHYEKLAFQAIEAKTRREQDNERSNPKDDAARDEAEAREANRLAARALSEQYTAMLNALGKSPDQARATMTKAREKIARILGVTPAALTPNARQRQGDPMVTSPVDATGAAAGSFGSLFE